MAILLTVDGEDMQITVVNKSQFAKNRRCYNLKAAYFPVASCPEVFYSTYTTSLI